LRQRQHKTVVTDNGVFYEVRLLIPRQLYNRLKFYERATGRSMEDLILEVLRGCIDEVEVL
jgi:predicted DNA-binding protein